MTTEATIAFDCRPSMRVEGVGGEAYVTAKRGSTQAAQRRAMLSLEHRYRLVSWCSQARKEARRRTAPLACRMRVLWFLCRVSDFPDSRGGSAGSPTCVQRDRRSPFLPARLGSGW